MREIKFRAWHEYGKRMKDPTEPGMIYDENPGDCLHWKSQGQKIINVMQYTGLTDKNGKEIYEGDIVIYAGYHFFIEWDDYFCRFHKKYFEIKSNGIKQIFPLCQIELLEIIGNIHENPEFLEELKPITNK